MRLRRFLGEKNKETEMHDATLSSQADDVHRLNRRQADVERAWGLGVYSRLIHILQAFAERIREAVVADDRGRVDHSSNAEN